VGPGSPDNPAHVLGINPVLGGGGHPPTGSGTRILYFLFLGMVSPTTSTRSNTRTFLNVWFCALLLLRCSLPRKNHRIIPCFGLPAIDKNQVRLGQAMEQKEYYFIKNFA